MAIRTSNFYPQRSRVTLSVGATLTALMAWLFAMLLLNLYLVQLAGNRHPERLPDHPEFFFQVIESWHQVGDGQWLSFQQALMFTQVLWLVWLWAKFGEARGSGKRISLQTYLVYGGLAMLLICQQQVFYRLFADLPETRLIPLTTSYQGDDVQPRFKVLN